MDDYKEHVKFVRDNKKNIYKILKKYTNDCIKLEKKNPKSITFKPIVQTQNSYIISMLINILSDVSDSIDENSSDEFIYEFIKNNLLTSTIGYDLYKYVYYNTKFYVRETPHIIVEHKEESKRISDEDILNNILNESGLTGRIKTLTLRLIIKLLQKISVKMKNTYVFISKTIKVYHMNLILRNMNDFNIDNKLFVHISETAKKIENAL